ncbi:MULTISPECIES: hypothetical protein [unclassified Aureispira]|uniref:hypothetical protein n=1 Tax=unclassified Aureispira TaxID=2649989 RepID=UPI000698F78D|nr:MULTISPECIES: hypothetical protein [unclassified Aureispira]WMX14768.1 hypothetical protein QP953_00090 [Aureispira sp. CCB-E]
MKLLDYLKNSLSEGYREEGRVVSSEPIQRSKDYCLGYAKWLKTNKHQAMLEKLYNASLNQKDFDIPEDPAINFLMIPKINGFTLQYDARRWKEEDFKYLFEYFATCLMQEHGFELVASAKEVAKYTDRVETVERYKLKNVKDEVDYSDVLVRLSLIDNEVSTIKFCATCTKKRITNLSHLLKKIAAA